MVDMRRREILNVVTTGNAKHYSL